MRRRFSEFVRSVKQESLTVKILFALSCLLVGGFVLVVVLGSAAWLGVMALIVWTEHHGTISAPAYAALDEQSFLKLENASAYGKEGAAVLAAKNHRVVLLAAQTPVYFEDQRYYDGDKLSYSPSPAALQVLQVKVLAGPEKGQKVWMEHSGVKFPQVAF